MHLSNYTFVILALVATIFAVVQAHTQVYNAGTNNIFGADFQYEIKNDYGNDPITSLTTTDLRCRSKSAITGTGVDKITINAGEDLDIRWRHQNNSVSLAVMSLCHVGPCMAYMAPLASQGDGDVWFKIYEEGWDANNNTWCTTKLINNNGYATVMIPANIPSGDYLVRTELLALQQATVVGGALFFPNCLVVTVNNGAGTSQPQGYAIPGIYSAQDPGILYNYKNDPSTYQIPGPAVFSSDTAQSDNVSGNTMTLQSLSEMVGGSSSIVQSSSEMVGSINTQTVQTYSETVSSSITAQLVPTTTLDPTPTLTQSSIEKCIPRPRPTNKCSPMRKRENVGRHVEM